MNMNEQERRELALASQGGEVLSARAIQPKDVLQMVSVRMDSVLVAELREIADSKGAKISDLLREAAGRIVAEYRSQDLFIETKSWDTLEPLPITPTAKIVQWNGPRARGMNIGHPLFA